MANQFQPPIITHAGPLAAEIFSHGSAEIVPVAQFGPLVVSFENGTGGNGFYDRRFRWIRLSQKRNPRLTQVRQGNWTDEGINEVVINVLNTIPEFARFNSKQARNSPVIPSVLPTL